MVKDTELYRRLLGIVAPWTVGRVEMDSKERRGDVWAAHPAGEGGLARTASSPSTSSTMPRSMSGAISTAAPFTPSSMLGSPAWSAPCMGFESKPPLSPRFRFTTWGFRFTRNAHWALKKDGRS